jgi:hypothetical protein
VGGAASVLTRERVLALAALGTGLFAYGAVSEHLPEFRMGVDVAFVGLVVLPITTAAIWLALPLAGLRSVLLLYSSAAAGALLIAFTLLGAASAANVAKLACFALLGFWFLSLFEQLWWVALVAILVPWVDVWSVAAGPSEYVLEKRPGIFDSVAVDFPVTGQAADINIGPPDIVFFALFIAASARFGLRTAWTWTSMTGFLVVTLVVAWRLDTLGLPALPAVSLGFLLPNADLIWRNVEAAWRSRREAPTAK